MEIQFMRSTPRLTTLAAGVSPLLLIAAHGVYAQQQLDEVVVTAERRVSDVQSTPISVSAFDASSIEQLGIIRTLDIQNSVPGLTLYTGAGSQSMLNVYMRGAGEQTGAMVTSESAVSFYVDDVYRGRLSGANNEFLDIERIEVLRGPQGTLYGRNSMTGAIKIVTRTPEPDEGVQAQVSAELASHNTRRLKATVSGPLVEGRLAGSLSGFYTENSAYYFNRARNEQRGEREMSGLRGKLNFRSDSGDTQAVLSGYFTRNEDDGRGWVITNTEAITEVPGIFSLTGGFRTTQSPVDEFGKNSQRGIDLNIGHDMGGVTLRSITAFNKQSDDWRTDLSGGPEVAPGVFLAGVDRLSVSNHEQLSQELQLSGEAFSNQLQWITGVYFLREEGLQVVSDVLFEFIPVLDQIIDVTTDSYAGFVQGTYALTDRLGLTAGIRYTRDSKSLQGEIADFPGSETVTTVDRRDTFTATTPKAALDFQLSDNILTYVSVGRGFKAGGYNSLLVADPVGFNTPFEAESLWAYELGIKGEFLNRRLRTNLAVYVNDFSDIQQGAAVAGSPSFPIQNAGDARVKGLELEVTAIPVDGLRVFGFIAVTDDEYRRLAPNSIAAISGATRLQHVSRFQSQLGFNYQRPLGAAFGNGTLSFGADWAYRSAYFADASTAQISRTEPFHLANAHASYTSADESWRLRAYGKNILSEEYSTIGLVLVNGIRLPSEPRILGLELLYRWR